MGESGPGKCKLRRPAGNPTAEEFLDAPSKAALAAVTLTLVFSLCLSGPPVSTPVKSGLQCPKGLALCW